MVSIKKSKRSKDTVLNVAIILLGLISAVVILSSTLHSSNNRNLIGDSATSTPNPPQQTHNLSSTNDKPHQTKSKEYPHDNPKHPWYWVRENMPSETESARVDCDGKNYKELYDFFHEYGYVVFTSCSLNSEDGKKNILEPNVKIASGIKAEDRRLRNAADEAGLALALDKDIVDFMEYIHGGRRTFPWQSLHFPVGTEQPVHSDLVHFDTMPRSLMSAAWTALEDMNENNGPLRFFPKSHNYGLWDGKDVGVHFAINSDPRMNAEISDQVKDNLYGDNYAKRLEETMKKLGIEPMTGHEMKKGQTLIWAASLIHGGSAQKDKSLSRLSTVTHYFFEGSEYYWSPKVGGSRDNRITWTPCHWNKALSSVLSCADMYIEERKKLYETGIKANKKSLDD